MEGIRTEQGKKKKKSRRIIMEWKKRVQRLRRD